MASEAVIPAVEGIGEAARRTMSRQAREAQARSVVLVNTGIERWTATRDYGTFVIPERHAWTPAERCAVCDGERGTHDADMEGLEEALRKREAEGKEIHPRALRGHDFAVGEEACAVCAAPRSMHSPDGRYAVLVVRGRMTSQDWGDKNKRQETVFADELAEDLIQEKGLGSRGVFVARGAQPTGVELRASEERRDNGYMTLVEEADSVWMRHHAIHMISDAAKRACIELGMDREWLYQVSPKMDCPRCGAKLKAGVAICMSCGAVLDREKYEAYEATAAATAAVNDSLTTVKAERPAMQDVSRAKSEQPKKAKSAK